MTELRKIKRALISVSDKSDLTDFAFVLADFGVEIISTGGTARSLRQNGLTVTEVSDVTGFPEMMDGRVKTLHPKIHGAVLAIRDNPEHVASMTEHGIEPIDLVVVNLYPFEETIAKDGVSLEEAVENIDIGGPAMIRSASKNWRDVAVVTDWRLYPEIVDEMKEYDGSLSLETRRRLASIAFSRTTVYDFAITRYLSRQLSEYDLERIEHVNPLRDLFPDGSEDFSEPIEVETGYRDDDAIFPLYSENYLEKIADLRYGENPHQKAALYFTGRAPTGIAGAEQFHGKDMSFNNYIDAEAAWNLVRDFDGLAVAIIKHTNPSGVATGSTNEEAYRRALSSDPVSAFGGIVAFNRKVDKSVAASVNEVFTEVVIAPDFDDEAIEIFKSKKNLRILRIARDEDQYEILNSKSPLFGLKPTLSSPRSGFEFRQISGGFLIQDRDVHQLNIDELNIVTDRRPTDAEMGAMRLAWTVCKHVKSNAIVFANNHQTLGVGAGQMNRVDSVRIAAMRAERFSLPLKGSALASDAFFPFRDNVDEAAKFGVSAIIQPGGSIKDGESIAAANEHGIAMAFTGIRHFKH